MKHLDHPRDMVPVLLSEYGAIIRKEIERYLPRQEPQRYLYDLVADYPRRGGRSMRPTLCMATARAFGAKVEDATKTAVAIELLHNALLVHDDIQDESEVRRGQPTLHLRHGIALAINAGDFLGMLSFRPLLDNLEHLGPELTLRVIEETARMATESAEGQALELGWRAENCTDVSESDYLVMVLKKTCWLASIHPMRVGALIATRDRIDLEPMVRFGFFLGAAFQIQDDLLNLEGDEVAYGKELNGDIHEGKRTLMLIRLLELVDAQRRAEIVAMLKQPRSAHTLAQISSVRTMMDEYECIDYARRLAHGLAGAAMHEFETIFGGLPASRDKTFIEGLITWVLSRS